MPRTSLRVAAAALVVALVPALSACSTGPNASTTTQQPSGNGSSANVGPMQLRGVTIVTEPFVLPVISRKLAFFSDPFGNLIELAEVLP